MGLFSKKETIFKEKNKELSLQIAKALKEAGFKGVSQGGYEVEPPVGGCGCKIDIRNMGKKGKIDRYMYYVDVLKDDAEAAKLIVDSVREEYLKQTES